MLRFLILSLPIFTIISSVHAQGTGAAICVIAYEDTNRNNVQEDTELPLPGININLATQGDIIIQSHISTEDTTPFCFEGLAPGTYDIYFADSFNHTSTAENHGTVEVSGSQRYRVGFSALSESPFVEAAEAVDRDVEVELTSRLAAGFLGAVIVVSLMLGVGIVYSAFIR
jgi:hypothetical protein